MFVSTECSAAAPLLLALLLSACAGNHTPAPVTDRSVALERVSPVIAPPGGGADVRPPAGSRGVTASTVSDTPAAAASATSGSASVSSAAVPAVNLGGGIARAPIGRLPAPAQPQAASDAAAVTTSTAGSISAPTPAVERPPRGYTVARGDTLFSIAFMHDVDYRRLALANNLSPPYTLYPGQELLLTEGAIDDSAVAAMPTVPPAPAGELAGSSIGERAPAAVEGRRTGNTPTRTVEGINWSWPAGGRVMSNFSGTGNRGVDIAGTAGDPVYAVADGDVVYAGRGIQGTGNLVILRHSARHLSAYMHNRSVAVSEGERVLAGDRVAEMGQGPGGENSIHFEIRVDGQPVDPMRYLPSR